MKKKLIILEVNQCDLPKCDCGFNIKLGGGFGETKESLNQLIDFLETKYELLNHIKGD